MDKKKSQHYNFTFEAIPALFHTQTNRFMEFIQKDGIDFLRFWWDYVAKELPDDKLVPFHGMDYEIIPVAPKLNVVIIKLPPPAEDGEAYFIGLIAAPEKHFAWVRMPNERVLVLVRTSSEKYASGTVLGDLTPRAIFVPIGEGDGDDIEKFKERVKGIAELRLQR